MKGNGNHVPTHSHTLDANLLSARHSQGEVMWIEADGSLLPML